MAAAPITYVIRYGVFFPSSADGIAARDANGGSILLGGMTPISASTSFPAGTVVQAGAFALFGLTGLPGPQSNVHADLQQGVGGGISWTPTSLIQATDVVTNLTETFLGTSRPVQVIWDGTLIFDGGGVLPPAVGPAAPIAGIFQIQVLTYTGNGIQGRQVTTLFDLTVGQVAVWVHPQITEESVFRHNDPAMTVSSLCGGTTSSGTGGILSFNATGFTVGNDGGQLIHCNETGKAYTAVIFQDTGTSYMALGKYLGRADITTTGQFTLGSPVVFCATFTANDLGRLILVEGVTYQIIGIPDATHFQMGTPSQSVGNKVIFSAAGGSTVPTGALAIPTLVWDFGRACCFADSKMPSGVSMALVAEAVPLTDEILALNAALPTVLANFTIGTSNNVNNNGTSYYFLALHVPSGDPAEAFFKTWKLTGTGAITQITGLTFQPIFAGARLARANVNFPGWRGPLHVGTSGQAFNGSGAIGLRAFGLGSIELDTDFSVAGFDTHGWALRDGRVVIEAPLTAPPPDEGGPVVCPLVFIPVTACAAPTFTDVPILLSVCAAPQPCPVGTGELPTLPPDDYY